jgi:glucan phosphoethanolaminetransferase (alkaline phosphatase superfamily)
LLLALAFVLLFILPEHVVRFVNPAYMPGFHLVSFLYMAAVFASLLFVKSNVFFYAFMTLSWSATLCGIMYHLQFGRHFTSYEIELLTVETRDILIGAQANLARDFYVILAVAASVAACIAIRRRTTHRSNWFMLPIVAMLGLSIYRGGRDINNYGAPSRNILNANEYAFKNTVDALAQLAARRSMSLFVAPLEPYKIIRTHDVKDNTTVIIMWLESASSNRMPMFGYPRDTTPNLTKWAPRLLVRPAISGGDMTRISSAMFFNLQREPASYNMSHDRPANMFRLAQSQGMKTVFYSPQNEDANFSGIGLEFAQTLDPALRQKEINDDIVLAEFKKIPLSSRNFLALNTRAVHFPYDNHKVKKFSGSPDRRIDDYDNDMLYLDGLMGQVLEYADKLPGRIYVVITSDHGEMFGEDGHWSHAVLHRGAAEVPFILFAKNVPAAELSTLKSKKILSHHDIALFVAGILGYRIENPNAAPGEFYINHSKIDGQSGYIKYSISDGKYRELKE